MKRIYLDNAASTPISPLVVDTMHEILKLQAGNPSSIHAEGRTARSLIENARKKIAQALNASLGEIFFTSGGTESDNMAIKCAVRDLNIRRIISSPIEHHAVLHSLEAVHRDFNINVVYLSVDDKGNIDLGELEKLLIQDETPTLVTLMHANNELGNLNDLKLISEICKKHQALFHTDAIQTVGHLKIDLQDISLDFLSASAHKFHGPKGIGFIFIRQGFRLKSFIDGGGQERNMRGGTESLHNIVGMATALDAAIAELESRKSHILELKNYLRHGVLGLNPDIKINGLEGDQSLYTVLSVSFPPNSKSDLLLLQLDMAGISASGGSACTSGAEAESHVLTAINHPEERKTIRFSFSHYNTLAELDILLSHLSQWFSSKA